MTAADQRYPKLRAVDPRPIVQNGRQAILLRDPLQLSEQTVVVPSPLHLALAYCDGTRENARALSASLAVRHGLRIPPDVITQLLQALDETYLLDNAASARARARALDAYRAAPYRPANSAGQSYPDSADQLKQRLDGYLASAEDDIVAGGEIRGLVSPHIDYDRGGSVYAPVWRRAADAANRADLALILGTDHYGDPGSLTLTRQHYATPFGVLPTAGGVVGALAEALGEEAAYAQELNHRSEHSIELAAVWLHHMRDGKPCELVPVLCGSFHAYTQGDADAASDPALAALIEAFQKATAGRQVLVVAAADLAHVGPAFGGHPVDLSARARLQAADEALIGHMRDGDAEGFLGEIQRAGDRNNVCGVPPIYLALRLLRPVQGDVVAYKSCPADGQGTSLVTVCGVTFRSRGEISSQ
jgi:AmmeMemoRadiSam system protein B